MKYILLILSIMLFSPIASSTTTTTIFTWVDDNVMTHFTDKKPKESIVDAELLTTFEIDVANVLKINTQLAQLPDVVQ